MDEDLATVLGAIDLMKKKLGEARTALMGDEPGAIATAKARLGDVNGWNTRAGIALKKVAPELFEKD